jgi:hypothetical protein
MVTNNLLIKLKQRSSDEIKKAKDMLLSMGGKIPVLLDIRVENDTRGPEGSAYDLMLITQFNELEDLDKYLNHPVHLEVSKYIKDAMETGASLCYRT